MSEEKVKMFKFVKIKDKFGNINNFTLLCDSLSILEAHTNIIMKGVYENAHLNFQNTECKGYHVSNSIANLWMVLSGLNGKNILESSIALEEKTLQDRIDMLDKYGKIYLDKNGTYRPPDEDEEIVEIIEIDSLDYPEYQGAYTLDDIRIIAWDRGMHFYAKVGDLDVVDKDGNQKWNTWSEAREQAWLFYYENFRNKDN